MFSPRVFVFASLPRSIFGRLILVYIILCYKERSRYIYLFIYLFIPSFIHKECPTGWRNGYNIQPLLYFTFCVLPAGNFHGFYRRSSANDHLARRKPQIANADDSVLWCCNSEFMATNASPGMMNISAHCRIASQS